MTIPIISVPIGFLAFVIGLAIILWLRRHRAGTSHPIRSTIIDSFLLLFSVISVLILAEMTLRLIDYNPFSREDMNVQKGYYHLAASQQAERPLHDEGVELQVETINGEPFWTYRGQGFNHFGGRGPEPANNKPAARYVWMGNSIVFGSNVDREKTFPALLQQMQNEAHPERPVEHVNLALPGYDLTRYKLALTRTLPELPTDWVVVGLWHGDMIAVKLVDRTLYRADVKVVDDVRFVHSLPFPESDVATWSKRSRLFLLLSVLIGNLTVETRYSDLSRAEKMKRDLADILAITQNSGAKLALAWFPPLDRPFPEQLQDFEKSGYNLRVELYTTAKRFAEEHKLPFFDVRQALQGEELERIRLDPCCHYNETGHTELAKRFFPWLETLQVESSD